MNVKGSAPLVPLVDPGQNQIPVENPVQFSWNVENRHMRWQPGRNGLSVANSFILKALQLVRKPFSQISGQIASDGNIASFPVLFVGGVENGIRNRSVENELPYGKRSQFTLSKAGKNQGLVYQRPL